MSRDVAVVKCMDGGDILHVRGHRVMLDSRVAAIPHLPPSHPIPPDTRCRREALGTVRIRRLATPARPV